MANVQQVQKRMLVSLAQIAKDINLNEGDYILIEKKDDGIFLRPIEWVDKKQKYFWTEQWQEKMQQSQQDLDNGNYKSFESMEDAIKDLEELANASNNQDK
ncbi:AbrB/MazE/SpoVT family DNA-binding domain-containing protein [Desulfosporosinus nitroreducens]|uniref:AbrB/MazE/SpoVT family DNA-binding domain-containing protein n=1 Tax=Desulfosporosinus nitroreducens TaxID=2018668 RepID=A0ABT8QXS3_9FIRM|nr:AbrB/MazE/SpoVT family DNA-binding domain-containing protein [Desulfosporosinus nitroreducens]MDO0825677.1 AbrB/MazE/SpoVT family DNA-binding domain-containing protein [Desulfosporosinus nitroreducens]